MADLKDDTPAEPSFLWRRSITIAVLIVNAIGVGYILLKIETPRELMWIGLALIGSNIIFALMYMAGASAVDLGKMGQGFSGFRPNTRRRYSPLDFGGEETYADDGKPI